MAADAIEPPSPRISTAANCELPPNTNAENPTACTSDKPRRGRGSAEHDAERCHCGHDGRRLPADRASPGVVICLIRRGHRLRHGASLPAERPNTCR